MSKKIHSKNHQQIKGFHRCQKFTFCHSRYKRHRYSPFELSTCSPLHVFHHYINIYLSYIAFVKYFDDEKRILLFSLEFFLDL